MTNLDDQLTGLQTSRRSVVRGAAWSIPVVAVAATAPAYAASPCDPRNGQVLDWDATGTAYARANDRRSATATIDPDGTGPIPSLTLSLATSYAGNMIPGTEGGFGTALTIANSVGGLGVSGLALVQATTSDTPVGRPDRGTYTFSFTRPVSNLVFTYTDIDSLAGDFRDVLEPSAGYTIESQGSAVTTDTNGPNGLRRFYASTSNAALNDTSDSRGNIRLKYAGPISSFSLTYWNAQTDYTVDTSQGIFISDMTFDYDPC